MEVVELDVAERAIKDGIEDRSIPLGVKEDRSSELDWGVRGVAFRRGRCQVEEKRMYLQFLSWRAVYRFE